jgi:hypothetical protein
MASDLAAGRAAYASSVPPADATTTFRFCDDRGTDGFAWVAVEPMTRTSHALVSDGRVWLIDPLAWTGAIERVRALGEPAGVVQLLDRHGRDCAALAHELGVPHLVVPDRVPDSPFEAIPLVHSRFWRETALWWPEQRVLVVAEALGTNGFFTGGRAPLGVHLLRRLLPPKLLAGLAPDAILVGHGEGIVGEAAPQALEQALRTSRRGLPGMLARLPAAWRRTNSQDTSAT